MKKNTILAFALLYSFIVNAQTYDNSVVAVNEESSLNLLCITSDNDYVGMPIVKHTNKGVSWLSKRTIDVSKDGASIAYISARNNSTNIFIKGLGKQGASIQRTNRSRVLDFCYSPDGKNIVFSEGVGNTNQLFVTDAEKGFVCRQISSSNQDFSPTYSRDMKQIFFARKETKGVSIWSYSLANNFLSSFAPGMNPCPLSDNSLLVARNNAEGRSEIWRVNYETGVEECIVSDTKLSFTTPLISPDNKWILFVGSSVANVCMGYKNDRMYYKDFHNTDIFVCRIDGTELTQLTYHASDDLSPVWSIDGKYIYFISQRGSSTNTANIWRMDFVY